MSGINTILSGLNPAVGGIGAGIPVQGSVTPPGQGSGASQSDVFEQGQWWLNRTQAKTFSFQTAAQCGCNNCPRCASQAYGTQARVASLGVVEPSTPTNDSVTAGGETAGLQRTGDQASAAGTDPTGSSTTETEEKNPAQPIKPDGEPLTEAEKSELAQLKQADTAVHAHEMAHIAVAGSYAKGGATFQYQKGPDGRNYAVGGEVQIDTSREPDPEATLTKMFVVRAAALAPADPSPQDRKVAAAATMAITQARQEIMEEQQDLESQKNVVGAGERYGAVSGQESSGMDGVEEAAQAVTAQTPQPNNANSIFRYTDTTPRIQSGGLDLTA